MHVYATIAFMDLVLLRSLLAVAEAGAVTEAAERIHVSQPALSRRLKQLEQHLGVELLARGRNGAELTPLGRLVEAEARLLVNRYDSLRQQVAAHLRLDTGTVWLGGGATAVSFLLPPAIAAFKSDYPEIRFRLKEAGSREIAQDVVNGALELGLVTLPVEARELDVEVLLDDKIVPVARQDHRLASHKRARTGSAELAGEAMVGFEAGSAIRHIIDATLRAAGVEVNVVMELRSIPAILRMVAATGYLAFVSRICLEQQNAVVEIAVRELSIERKLALVTRRGIPLSPAANAFAKCLRKLSQGSKASRKQRSKAEQ